MFIIRLTLFVLLVLVSGQNSDAKHLVFKNYSVPDGLSNLNVTSIAQDDLGYIWIGTRRGLNRYNGYEFTHFFQNVDDVNSLYSSNINKVYVGNDGLIFIGTTAGLNYYDSKTETIGRLFSSHFFSVVDILEYNGYIYVATLHHGLFRFQTNDYVMEPLGDNWVKGFNTSGIHVDSQGVLWVSFLHGKGFAAYDNSSNTYHYYKDEQSEMPQFSNSVLCIHELSNGVLVLGTENGLNFFDMHKRTFVDPKEFRLLTNTLKGQEISFISEFREGEFWAGSKTDGLFYFNIQNSSISNYSANQSSYNKIHSNTYNTCSVDKNGDLWLGTFDKGLNVYFKQRKAFNFDSNLNNLINNEFITNISEDHLNRLIITTRKSGLFIYDRERQCEALINPSNSNMAYPYLRSLLVDSYNRYWIGSGYYLQIFENTKGLLCENVSTSLLYSPIVCLHQQGNMVFAGTENQGIWVYDMHGDVVFQSDKSGSNITDFAFYSDDEFLFISHGFGVFTMNTHDFTIRKVQFPGLDNYPGVLSAVTIHYDKQGRIWIGSYNHGLIMLDKENGTIRSFGTNYGLPSNDVVGILEDDFGRLWLSTSFGLARFNMSDFKVKTYSYKDGLNNYQFHEKAAYKDENGILYFGGNNGITYFKPDILTETDSVPLTILLDELYINNEKALASSSYLLDKSIVYTKYIKLSHRDRIFSINYLAFDYYNSENLEYYYMLEGFDENWNYAGSQRRVSYSNLHRGSYTFKVKVVNDEGVSSELSNGLNIRVMPAPWFSNVAWILYVSALIGLVVFLSQLYVKSILIKKELELEQVLHRRDTEINDMKKRFFANIAHEFRTPLTLLKAIFQQIGIIESTPTIIKDHIKMAGSNVERLLKLVNQLLAFRTIESEVMPLWIKESDLNSVMQAIINDISVLAKEKDIEIFFIEDNEYLLYFDADIIEKILTNLLSNAVKHSEPGGQIEVMVNKAGRNEISDEYEKIANINELIADTFIEISVIDHGKGIDTDKMDDIFDRYIQSEAGHGISGPDYSSIGIGLNFTKKLVELHKGFIRAHNTPGGGATFSFLIPCDLDAYDSMAFTNSDAISIETTVPIVLNNSIQPDFDKTVLVVEDDTQLNAFLRKIISQYYKVVFAYNGEEALGIIQKKNPDLIVSDVVMPKMNGIEFIKRLRGSVEMSHLPVILLSSKSEIKDQIEGLKSGADCYVPKPFDIDLLLHTIDSQLRNRSRIHEIFFNGKIPELKEYEGNQDAMSFIAQLDKTLEDNLANTELDIAMIAEKMNMSRSSFYRKFLCITNLTPIAYLKKYRINKSLEFLKNEDISVQVVSEMVGFSSPSYFSTAFKRENKMSPSEYIASIKNEDIKTL